MEKLVVFDLDGTIVVEPVFYRKFYSGTLTQLVKREKGKKGLEVLEYYRKNFSGRGELSLFMLNIPFKKWREELVNSSLDLISPKPMLVAQIRELEMKKVIYTGSPEEMALRILERVGFREGDFDCLFGWKEPELFPVKWSCSPIMFEYILEKYQVNPKEAWSVGDNWETDLVPAQKIGMKTAKVGKPSGNPTVQASSIEEFLDYLKR